VGDGNRNDGRRDHRGRRHLRRRRRVRADLTTSSAGDSSGARPQKTRIRTGFHAHPSGTLLASSDWRSQKKTRRAR
jgi:hypothetical protein